MHCYWHFSWQCSNCRTWFNTVLLIKVYNSRKQVGHDKGGLPEVVDWITELGKEYYAYYGRGRFRVYNNIIWFPVLLLFRANNLSNLFNISNNNMSILYNQFNLASCVVACCVVALLMLAENCSTKLFPSSTVTFHWCTFYSPLYRNRGLENYHLTL